MKIKCDKIGVVIVNYMSYYDTINYVNYQLLKQKRVELKIVIVDNASPNSSVDKLVKFFKKNLNISILKNSINNGYAIGNNIGIRFLENKDCDYILISNNDIELKDDMLLAKMASNIRQISDVAFISPLMLINNKISYFDSAWRLPTKVNEIVRSTYLLNTFFYYYCRAKFYKIDNKLKKPLKVDCLPGSFFMGKSEVFGKIKYFDEGTFLYNEEIIIGEKVKAIRLNNYLITGLTYTHNASKTIDQFNSQIQKYKFLLESKIYYWRTYKNANFVFIITLKFLYKLRECELQCLKFLKTKKHV